MDIGVTQTYRTDSLSIGMMASGIQRASLVLPTRYRARGISCRAKSAGDVFISRLAIVSLVKLKKLDGDMIICPYNSSKK